MASSGPAPTGPCLSCAEGSRAARRSTAELSPELSRRAESDPLPHPAGRASFDAAQDTVGFLGCESTPPGHVQLFIHQHPQVFLSRAALNPVIPQLVLILGVAPTQVQDLALLNLMRFIWAHFLNWTRTLCMASCPSNMLTVPLSLVSSTNLLSMHSAPLSVSLMKTLKNTVPNALINVKISMYLVTGSIVLKSLFSLNL